MTINLADTKYGIANSLKDTIYTRKAPATTAFSTLRITFFNRCKQFGIWKLYWKYYQFEIITNYLKILPIRDSSDKAREKNKLFETDNKFKTDPICSKKIDSIHSDSASFYPRQILGGYLHKY